jgi:hypothetical protein
MWSIFRVKVKWSTALTTPSPLGVPDFAAVPRTWQIGSCEPGQHRECLRLRCIRELYRENAYEWKYFLDIDLSANDLYSIGWNHVSGPLGRPSVVGTCKALQPRTSFFGAQFPDNRGKVHFERISQARIR